MVRERDWAAPMAPAVWKMIRLTSPARSSGAWLGEEAVDLLVREIFGHRGLGRQDEEREAECAVRKSDALQDAHAADARHHHVEDYEVGGEAPAEEGERLLAASGADHGVAFAGQEVADDFEDAGVVVYKEYLFHGLGGAGCCAASFEEMGAEVGPAPVSAGGGPEGGSEPSGP